MARVAVVQASREEAAELIQAGLDHTDRVVHSIHYSKAHGEKLLKLAETEDRLLSGNFRMEFDEYEACCPVAAAGLTDETGGLSFALGFDKAVLNKWPEESANAVYIVMELV